jgi:hypothetical protein
MTVDSESARALIRTVCGSRQTERPWFDGNIVETLWKHCGRIAIIIIRSNQSEGVGTVTSVAWDRLDGAWDSAPWMAISANLTI